MVDEILHHGSPDVNSPIINFCARYYLILKKEEGGIEVVLKKSCCGETDGITMVHYFAHGSLDGPLGL